MRLAIFKFEDGRRLALLPTKVCIFEAGPSDNPRITWLQEDDNDLPHTIQGTFEEAVLEVNKALSDTVPPSKVAAPIKIDSNRPIVKRKKGTCPDCGSVLTITPRETYCEGCGSRNVK